MLLALSDLHLEALEEPRAAAFLELLAGRARIADRVLLLGDVFEAWIGDDDDAPLARGIAEALQALTGSGVEVGFVHGNRDFLVGEAFAARTGVRLLPDPWALDLHGRRYLFSHGDALCTDDAEYQGLRALVRDPDWQRDLLARPLEERRALGEALRTRSREANANKPSAIMDVNAEAVAALLRAHGADWLVHGHTHRPSVHRLGPLNGPVRGPCARLVLGDWGRYAWWCEIHEDGEPRLFSRPIAP